MGCWQSYIAINDTFAEVAGPGILVSWCVLQRLLRHVDTGASRREEYSANSLAPSGLSRSDWSANLLFQSAAEGQ